MFARLFAVYAESEYGRRGRMGPEDSQRENEWKKCTWIEPEPKSNNHIKWHWSKKPMQQTNWPTDRMNATVEPSDPKDGRTFSHSRLIECNTQRQNYKLNFSACFARGKAAVSWKPWRKTLHRKAFVFEGLHRNWHVVYIGEYISRHKNLHFIRCECNKNGFRSYFKMCAHETARISLT